MTYRTLLVHIDESPPSDARVDFAFDLARKYDAHLIGLYAVCEVLRQLPFNREDSLRLAQYEAQRQHAHEAFAVAAQRAGGSAEWRAPKGPALDVVTLNARHADLLVFGRHDPHEPGSYAARHFVEDVLMSSGVPVVIVPHFVHVASFGENVFVAWDGSREAARALADALPILKRARFVEVASVERSEYDEPPDGVGIVAYLDRHEVHASFFSMPRAAGMDVGATLLNKASDLQADLLVLGAYGHTRALERVLGGVTRTMLESMPVPVLMSH
jgi:nucleotide-binding universal stress UspA family protein